MEEVSVGDSISKVIREFGPPDQVFSFPPGSFGNLKKFSEEDSVYIRYYRGTNLLNSNGVKLYSDSNKVLLIKLNDL